MANKQQINDFINTVGALAVEVCKERGYGNAQVWSCILQAALETGWGGSNRMIKANALFGVKATKSWVANGGAVYNTKTREVYSGKTEIISSDFKAYPNLKASVEDYYNTISKMWPTALKAATVKEYITTIQSGTYHYATDPAYVATILTIYKGKKSQIEAWNVGTVTEAETKVEITVPTTTTEAKASTTTSTGTVTKSPTQAELLSQYYAALAKMHPEDTQAPLLSQYYAALAKQQQAATTTTPTVETITPTVETTTVQTAQIEPSGRRKVLIDTLQSWLGYNEANGSHMAIINFYNSYAHTNWNSSTPWCAITASAAAIAANCTDIVPITASCNDMIAKFKKLGSWQEDESVMPNPGWYVFYDWQDVSGTADNQGIADHVGVVVSTEGTTFKVIEGNYSNSVKIRTFNQNAKYLRGFGVPKYGDGVDDNASASAFEEGREYTLLCDMYIRRTPNGQKLKLEEIPAELQEYAYVATDGYAVVKAGTKVTCNGNGTSGASKWIKLTDCYVCGIGSKGKVYIQ